MGNIYPADLKYFKDYRFDPDTQQYLDFCTKDQLCRMYATMGYDEGTDQQQYDLEAVSTEKPLEEILGAVYVSGYMACLYLADLAYRDIKGDGAVTFDGNGDMVSISSEKLRGGTERGPLPPASGRHARRGHQRGLWRRLRGHRGFSEALYQGNP